MNAILEKNATRAVEHVSTSQIAPVGTFTVRRALPFRERHSVGPWVFLDHFGPFRVKPGEDGVGPHPHAGIETVTYLLSGCQEHRDSAGHVGIVAAGGVQWMIASAAALIHAEKPLPGDRSRARVAWDPALDVAAQAREDARSAPPAPRCRFDSDREGRGCERSRHRGRVPGHARAWLQTLMPTLLWHVSIDAGATFEAPLPEGYEAGAYVISGTGRFGAETALDIGKLAVFEGTEGALRVENTGSVALEVLVLAGAPAEGPLVFHGPFVMNSVEQVRAAEIAYRTGRMGRLEES